MLGKAKQIEVSKLIDSKLSDVEDRLTVKIEQALLPITGSTQGVTEDNNTSGIETVEDPGLDSLFKAESQLIAQMVNPKYKLLRGRRGTVLVNETLEQLNSIRDMIRDRKNYRTQTKVR